MISTNWLIQKELHPSRSKKDSSSFMHCHSRHHPAFDLPSNCPSISSSSLSSSNSSTTTAAGQPYSPKDIQLRLQTHRHYQHQSAKPKVPFTLTIPQHFPRQFPARQQSTSEKDDPSYPTICLDGRQSCTSTYRQNSTSYFSSQQQRQGSTASPSPKSFHRLPNQFPNPPRRAPPPVPTGLTAFVTHTTSPLEDANYRLHHHQQNPMEQHPLTSGELRQYWPSSRQIVSPPPPAPNRHPQPHEAFARNVSRTLRFGDNGSKSKSRYSYVKTSGARQQQQGQQRGHAASNNATKENGRKRFRTPTPTTMASSNTFMGKTGATTNRGTSSLMQGLFGWLNGRMHSRHTKKHKHSRPQQSADDLHAEGILSQDVSLSSSFMMPAETGTPHTYSQVQSLRQCSSFYNQPSAETLRARETQAQEYARTIKALWQMADEEERAYLLAVEQHEWTDEGTMTEADGDDHACDSSELMTSTSVTASAPSAIHTGMDDFWQWHSGVRPTLQHQTRFGAGHLHYQERQAQRRKRTADEEDVKEEQVQQQASKDRNEAVLFEHQKQRSKHPLGAVADEQEQVDDDEREEAQVLYHLRMQYGAQYDDSYSAKVSVGTPFPQTRMRSQTASTMAEHQYSSYPSYSSNQSSYHIPCGAAAHNIVDTDMRYLLDETEEIESHFEMERALHSRVIVDGNVSEDLEPLKDERQQQEQEQKNTMHTSSLTRAIRASVARPRMVVLESDSDLDLASTKRRIQAQREQKRRWNGW